MPFKIRTTKYPARALHFTVKIADRLKNIHFFQEILGMKVLRHEEFIEGHDPSANGYVVIIHDRSSEIQWSKTLFGYGPEDDHFAIQLVWNSGSSSFVFGNNLIGITIVSQDSIARAKALKWPVNTKDCISYIESPDGYRFWLIDEPEPIDKDPIVKVTLASSSIDKTTTYWIQILGMALSYFEDNRIVFTYDPKQIYIEFLKISEPINHGTVPSRITFSVPYKDLQDVETRSRDTYQKIIKPMQNIDVSEKLNATIVLLADSDGHEICFLDDESFRKISIYDPLAESFLYYCIKCK